MKRLTIVTTAYDSERYIENYFEGILNLSNVDQIQVMLVMNVPGDIEKHIAYRYKEHFPPIFRIVEVNRRETIGASLNRVFLLADTPFTAFLDVDDLRVHDSFERQMAILDKNPEVDYTYGDFIVVNEQGKTEGRYVNTLEYDPIEFKRGCHTSPTHLFRTSLLKKIGGFDEQLKSGGDFDFQVRAAFNCKFKKTPGVMCYYTKQENSGSASSNMLQPVERTVVELRYGLYDKTDELNGYRYVSRAQKYRLDHLLINGQWKSVEEYIPNYRQMMMERKPALRRFERRYYPCLVRSYMTSLMGMPNRGVRKLAQWVLRHLGLLKRVRAWRAANRT